MIAKSFISRMRHLISEDSSKSLIDKFNLQMYANFIVLELSDKQTMVIDKLEQNEAEEETLAATTIDLCRKAIDELYL